MVATTCKVSGDQYLTKNIYYHYHLQGENQLDCNWLMMRSDEEETPNWREWAKRRLAANTILGSLTGASTWLSWTAELAKGGVELRPVLDNLVDRVWEGKGVGVQGPVEVQEVKYAGKTWQDKVLELFGELEKKEADGMVVTALDEIAWLFNMRGSDIPHSPVFRAYSLVLRTPEPKITLYTNKSRLSPIVLAHLGSLNCKGGPGCVHLKDYTGLLGDLEQDKGKGKILLGQPWAYTGGASYAVFNAVPEARRLVDLSPIMLAKSQKNAVEVAGMEEANIKDAVAVVALLAELEAGMAAGERWKMLKEIKMFPFHISQLGRAESGHKT